MGGSSRLFVGRLHPDVGERDLETFFRGYKLVDIVVKRGYAFVEFESRRDAEDAVHDTDGKRLLGDRVSVEFSNAGGSRYGGRYDPGGDGGRYMGQGRFPAPVRTRNILKVENLTTRYSWQDLKDMLRAEAGVEASFADAHVHTRNLGEVHFKHRSDLKRAMDKLQGKEINGRAIKLVDDSIDDRSLSPVRGRGRSHSPRRRSASRSPPRRKHSPVRAPSDSGGSEPARKKRSPEDRRHHSSPSSRSTSRSPPSREMQEQRREPVQSPPKKTQPVEAECSDERMAATKKEEQLDAQPPAKSPKEVARMDSPLKRRRDSPQERRMEDSPQERR